jgi:hypothetical protein
LASVISVAPLKLTLADLPSVEGLPSLAIGETLDVEGLEGNSVEWFQFHTDTRRSLMVLAEAEGADLVAALYDLESLSLIEVDDDSGGKRNPEIRATVNQGTYLLRITEFGGGDVPSFAISLYELDEAQ